MTKQKAIKAFCIDCTGGQFKERILCTGLTCPLWEYRLGMGTRSSRYKAIIDDFIAKNPKDIAELKDYGMNADSLYSQKYLPEHSRLSLETQKGGVKKAKTEEAAMDTDDFAPDTPKMALK